jgi:hypothetical protein
MAATVVRDTADWIAKLINDGDAESAIAIFTRLPAHPKYSEEMGPQILERLSEPHREALKLSGTRLSKGAKRTTAASTCNFVIVGVKRCSQWPAEGRASCSIHADLPILHALEGDVKEESVASASDSSSASASEKAKKEKHSPRKGNGQGKK